VKPLRRTFRDALRRDDFVLTAQLPITPGTAGEDVRNAVGALRDAFDAVQVPDNPGGFPHISPIAAASLALDAGLDAVVHLTCRDRNRIALQSDLMGAAAVGVTSLVLTRGERMPASLKPKVKSVFDMSAQRLIATAQALAANERLVPAPGFFIGSNVTALDPPENWAAEGIDGKADLGIKFVQTQPCLDVDVLRRYMAALVARKLLERLSVIVQVPLVDSMEMVQELRKARRPLLASVAVVARLRQASDLAAEGEALCAEVLEQVAQIPGVSGANLVYRGEHAAAVRVAARVRAKLQA
jgi:methylenetetrahydrofolate reductase (NADPH)